MKKIIYSAILAVAVALSLTSCEGDTSAGLTRITYYPVLELQGGDVVLDLGEEYVEPGVVATLNGEDVSSQVTISDNIDNTACGVYKVNYSVLNDDGFAANASRNVYVVNPGNVATVYLAESQYGSRHFYDNPIQIFDNGNGTYTIEDILGGFYSLGRYPGYEAYGYDFWADAVIKVADGKVELVSVGDWQWGAYPITIAESSVDADGIITLNLDFDGDPFYVQLVPITK